MFSTLPKTNLNFLVTYILLSADALKLVQSNISLLDIELIVRKVKFFLTFSSPEHNLLKVSFCGRPVSVVHRQLLPCGHSRDHISCSMDLKFGQNLCLDKIWDKLEFGSPGVIN